jgi:hypothetical protein
MKNIHNLEHIAPSMIITGQVFNVIYTNISVLQKTFVPHHAAPVTT